LFPGGFSTQLDKNECVTKKTLKIYLEEKFHVSDSGPPLILILYIFFNGTAE
jgi:hypothetical protein